MIDQKLKDSLINLKNELYEDPLLKEYFETKNALLSSKSLQKSDKLILVSKYSTLKKEEKQRYAYLRMHKEENPLVNNFFVLKEEVENLIEEVNELFNL